MDRDNREDYEKEKKVEHFKKKGRQVVAGEEAHKKRPLITVKLTDEDKIDSVFQQGIDKLEGFDWVSRIDEELIEVKREFIEIFKESYEDCVTDPCTTEQNFEIFSHPLMIFNHKTLAAVGGDADSFSGAVMIGHKMLEKIGDLDDPALSAFWTLTHIICKLRDMGEKI